MKQKDIALIIIIAFVSAIASFFISRAIFSSPSDRDTKVEKVENISAEFTTPPSKYFNAQSVNPTLLIQIGNSTNSNPFTGAPQ